MRNATASGTSQCVGIQRMLIGEIRMLPNRVGLAVHWIGSITAMRSEEIGAKISTKSKRNIAFGQRPLVQP